MKPMDRNISFGNKTENFYEISTFYKKFDYHKKGSHTGFLGRMPYTPIYTKKGFIEFTIRYELK